MIAIQLVKIAFFVYFVAECGSSEIPNKILNEDQILGIILRVETAIRQDFQRDRDQLSSMIIKMSSTLKNIQTHLDDTNLQNTVLKRELAMIKETYGKSLNMSEKEISQIQSTLNVLSSDVRQLRNKAPGKTIQQIQDASLKNHLQLANLSLELELLRQSKVHSDTQTSTGDLADIKAIVSKLATDVSALKIAGLNIESKLGHLLRAQSGQDRASFSEAASVAFLAYLTHSKHIVDTGDTVVFGEANTNVGGSFDNNTGVFTSQIAGIYTFSVTITAGTNSTIGYIMKNSQPVAHYANTREEGTFRGGPFCQASVTVTLHLNEGDRIYVLWYGEQQASLVYHYHHSYFSGHLVHADQLYTD